MYNSNRHGITVHEQMKTKRIKTLFTVIAELFLRGKNGYKKFPPASCLLFLLERQCVLISFQILLDLG